jgi:hypothetical protein
LVCRVVGDRASDRGKTTISPKQQPQVPAIGFLNNAPPSARMPTAFSQDLRRIFDIKKDLLVSKEPAAYLPEDGKQE